MANRPCLICGTPTARGPRCPAHRLKTPPKPGTIKLGRQHKRLTQRTVATWVAEHGWTCPGYGVPPHPVAEGKLEGDHVVPVSVAPELVHDPDNYAVLCRPCNARKGGANRAHWRST